MKGISIVLALIWSCHAVAEKKPPGYLDRLLAAVEKITGEVQADVKKGMAESSQKTDELKKNLEKLSKELEASIDKAPAATKKEGQSTLTKLKAYIESLGDKVFDDAEKTAKQLMDSADKE